MNTISKMEELHRVTNYRVFIIVDQMKSDESMDGVEDYEFYHTDDNTDKGYVSVTYY